MGQKLPIFRIENISMKITGGKAAVEALRAAGVDKIFGLMGSSTLDMYDALYDAKDIQHIGVRDERAGAHMADAYGRIKGRPGVIIAGQSGPGSTNLVTGLAQAKLAYSPVLAITGLPMTQHSGKDSFQEIDQHTLFLPVTKRAFTVPSAKRIPEFISDAMRIANSGRKGPVLLNIARDLFSEQIAYEKPKIIENSINAGHVGGDVLVQVLQLIEKAESPAIIVGGGVKWARGHNEVLKLAESLQLPMAASSGHGDVVPNDHPLYFGYAGPEPYGNPVARELIQGADVIIALGTRLGFSTTMYGHDVIPKGVKIIQVDLDAGAIGSYYPVTLGIVGDASQFAACLVNSLDGKQIIPHKWIGRNNRIKSMWEALWRERDSATPQASKPLSPEQAFRELRNVIPRNSIIALDSGTLCRQAADLLRYYEPPALLTPLDFALVGFGYAAGIGAKVAAPNRPVISLAGDGGFGMTAMEICTSVQSGINTVGIVLDNECWGAEKAYQRDFYNGRFIADTIISPRYDVLAKSCGAEGFFVTEPGELADAVKMGLKADKPVVIHVKIDPDAIVSSRKDALKHRLSESHKKE
jgi:thiamine pyrophosphate-dependent acetolactate synthase large subunit-like protein